MKQFVIKAYDGEGKLERGWRFAPVTLKVWRK